MIGEVTFAFPNTEDVFLVVIPEMEIKTTFPVIQGYAFPGWKVMFFFYYLTVAFCIFIGKKHSQWSKLFVFSRYISCIL